jgi:hypothetical protein
VEPASVSYIGSTYALPFPEVLEGVWAGTNETKRALMRRASA